MRKMLSSMTRNVLDTAEPFWITTVGADGRPHVTPLVTVWLDDSLYFNVHETDRKNVNLPANPHVVLITGCSTWGKGLDVVVEGDAAPVTDCALLTRLADAWSAKWGGRWRYQVRDGRFSHPYGGHAMVYSLAAAKVLAFS